MASDGQLYILSEKWPSGEVTGNQLPTLDTLLSSRGYVPYTTTTITTTTITTTTITASLETS